jgi:GntR family transcriptional repressor for pyruvate dehydrogenase complex
VTRTTELQVSASEHPPPGPTMSQTDVVVYGIKQMIVDGELTPGAQLPIEKVLAPRLGVSRGSLREGVRALSIMGVLETRQGAGTFVTSLDASLLLTPMGFVVDLQHSEGIRQVHSVRRILETAAAGRAAMTISDAELEEAAAVLDESERAMQAEVKNHDLVLECDLRFHRVITHASDNAVLGALIEGLSSKTVRARLWRAIHDEQAELVTLGEHRAILQALREHDPERAQVRMAAHLLAVEDFLRDQPVAVDGDAL